MSARIAVFVLGGLLPAAATAEQELGRLFLTPEQRAALDARRKARIAEKPAAVVPVSPVTRVDGYVRREGGRSTVWLDGVPVPEGMQAEGVRVAPARRDPLGVAVTLGEDERRFELKAGQKLDRASGEVRDVVAEDAIRIRRGGAPR